MFPKIFQCDNNSISKSLFAAFSSVWLWMSLVVAHLVCAQTHKQTTKTHFWSMWGVFLADSAKPWFFLQSVSTYLTDAIETPFSLFTFYEWSHHPIIQFKFFFFSAPSFLAIFCVCNEEYCCIVWYEPSCVDQNENEGNHPNQKGNGGKNTVLN